MTGSKEATTENIFEIYSNSGNLAYSMSAGTPRIEYRESMIDHTIRINAAIVDSAQSGCSAAEALKLQGGEKVIFKYTDGAGNSLDFTNENALKLSNNSFQVKSFNSSSFIAQVVSKEFLDNKLLKNRVTKRYSGKISNTVESILKDDLKTDKKLNISKTVNTFSDYGLRREPFEVILELQQMAIPDLPREKRKTAGFFFWQTSKGFYFKSPDEIFDGKPIKKYIYNFQVNTEELPGGGYYDDKILDVNLIRVSDVEKQLDSGATGTVTDNFDLIKFAYSQDAPVIGDGTGKVLSGDKFFNFGGEYTNNPTNFFQVNIANGMAYGTGDPIEMQLMKSKEENFSVSETIGQAVQNYRQRLNFMTEIKIPGDFSLQAGDIIQCDLPELCSKATPDISPKDSGIYMILELCHYISPTQTYTGLSLVRDSFGVKV